MKFTDLITIMGLMFAIGLEAAGIRTGSAWLLLGGLSVGFIIVLFDAWIHRGGKC